MKQQLKDMSIRAGRAIGIGIIGTIASLAWAAMLAFSCIFVASFFSGQAAVFAFLITGLVFVLTTSAFMDRW